MFVGMETQRNRKKNEREKFQHYNGDTVRKTNEEANLMAMDLNGMNFKQRKQDAPVFGIRAVVVCTCS
jgi:hypothetical protein